MTPFFLDISVVPTKSNSFRYFSCSSAFLLFKTLVGSIRIPRFAGDWYVNSFSNIEMNGMPLFLLSWWRKGKLPPLTAFKNPSTWRWLWVFESESPCLGGGLWKKIRWNTCMFCIEISSILKQLLVATWKHKMHNISLNKFILCWTNHLEKHGLNAGCSAKQQMYISKIESQKTIQKTHKKELNAQYWVPAIMMAMVNCILEDQ